MNLKYCLTGILCLFLKSDAQEIKSLTIGDKVPDVVINNIYNYPALQSSLSAFNNKLIILDFMASTCISCLKALPRFDSIQKIYGDKLQIFLVTYEKKDKVVKFLQKHNTLKLPIIGEDTILKKYFPHTFISHEVWIHNGVVKAITGTEYVTAANIEMVLRDKIINWPVKNDIAEFDYNKPLLHPDESVIPYGSYPQNIFYSAFSGYMNDIPHRYRLQRDSARQAIKFSLVNKPIIDMYARSYNKEFLPGHILLEVRDRRKYVYDRSMYMAEWRSKNAFCYEAILPLSTSLISMQEKIRSELDLFLGLHGRTEMRKVNALVLVCTDTSLLPAPVKGRTIPLSSLVYALNKNIYGLPVMDETGLTRKIKLALDPLLFSNIPHLQEALKKYGLQLVNALRDTEMLVITEPTIY
ncbi:MAG: Peptidyl-prolyl cis-trans isomerase [Chitinophagaceae bacterium]|nr:Peptidyl-prolyl cis-trans isomerase [Chitinophagaceae bacterium]